MKQTLLFAIIFSCAQNIYSQWNINGGLTIANYNANTTGYDNMQKSSAGAFIKISQRAMLNNFFYIEPGAGFNTTKTIEEKGAGTKTSNFILPIEIGIKASKSFRIHTGYQINFLFKAKSIKGSSEIDITENYKSIYGDVILGAEFAPGGKNVAITAKYHIGTSKVLENTYYDHHFTKNVFYTGLKITL